MSELEVLESVPDNCPASRVHSVAGAGIVAAAIAGTEASIWVVIGEFQENIDPLQPTWQKVAGVVGFTASAAGLAIFGKLKNRNSVS